MKTEPNIFPELSETAKEEAGKLLKKFSEKLVQVAEDRLSDLYTEYLPHIETDAWMNFRRDVFNGLKNYPTSKELDKQDWKEIRKVILNENREELINDINSDLLEEIARLKERIVDLEKTRY